MAHVKQTGVLPGPIVTLDMAKVLVLQRHRVPREWDHLSAIGNVKVVELGLLRWR